MWRSGSWERIWRGRGDLSGSGRFLERMVLAQLVHVSFSACHDVISAEILSPMGELG